jgi:hypothetical protein
MGLQAWASFWIMVLLESLIYMDYTSIAERTNSYTAIMEDIQCHNPSLRDLDISHRKQIQFGISVLVSHIVLLRVEQSLQLGHVREKKSKWNIP